MQREMLKYAFILVRINILISLPEATCFFINYTLRLYNRLVQPNYYFYALFIAWHLFIHVIHLKHDPFLFTRKK